MSHALRNSLSVIVTGSALLLRNAPTAEDGRARRQLEAIQRAALRMNRILQSLTELEHLESGALPLDRHPHAAADILSGVAAELASAAREKSVAITVGAAEGAVTVCDRVRIEEALTHLVGNALKATEPGGAITLTGARQGPDVRLSVADTGRGMTADELANIFDRRWLARRKAHDGLGLGLALARGIVRAHGSELHVESREGAGATFWFTLPAK